MPGHRSRIGSLATQNDTMSRASPSTLHENWTYLDHPGPALDIYRTPAAGSTSTNRFTGTFFRKILAPIRRNLAGWLPSGPRSEPISTASLFACAERTARDPTLFPLLDAVRRGNYGELPEAGVKISFIIQCNGEISNVSESPAPEHTTTRQRSWISSWSNSVSASRTTASNSTPFLSTSSISQYQQSIDIPLEVNEPDVDYSSHRNNLYARQEVVGGSSAAAFEARPRERVRQAL